MSRLMERDATTGRYVSRKHPRCALCGWYLVEDLRGRLRCLHEGCIDHGKVVDQVPGVQVSAELAAALDDAETRRQQ